MLKKTVKYTDFDNVERTDTLYFNLTQAELLEIEIHTPGGMEKTIKNAVSDEKSDKIFDIMKELIMKSYGEKNSDGKFIKTAAISEAFSHTECYSTLLFDVLETSEKAANFFNAIISPQVERAN
jgi:hypothetical protein